MTGLTIPRPLAAAALAAAFLAAPSAGARAQTAYWAVDGVLVRHDSASATRKAAVPMAQPAPRVHEFLGTFDDGRLLVSLGTPETEPGGDVVRGVDIAVMSPDGTVERVIRRDALRAYPAPVGRKAAIIGRDHSLAVWGEDGEQPVDAGGRVVLAAWSPDATRLCVTAYPPDWSPSRVTNASGPDEFLRLNNNDLVLCDLPTSTVERLTDTPGYDYSAVFSPDGRRVFFISGRDGRGAFFILDLATRETRKITNTEPGSYDVPVGRSDTFTWTAATDTLVYEAQETDHRSSVRVVRADGTAARMVARGTRPRTDAAGLNLLYLDPAGAVAAAPVEKLP